MDKKWPFGFFVYSNIGDQEESVQESVTEPVEMAAPAEEITEADMDKILESKIELPTEADQPDTIISEPSEQDAPVEESIKDIVEEPVEEMIEEVAEEGEESEETFAEEDDADDEDLPALEEELEIALEAAHVEQVKKNRLITGITAGVALLGAVGLATGLAIHAHFKKK